MRKHILLFTILISCSAYACPDTNDNKSVDHVPLTLKEQITDHPVQTTLGLIAALYGLKLMYEANKTYAIKPDYDGTYNYIAVMTHVTGAILTLTGAATVCKVLTDKNKKNT